MKFVKNKWLEKDIIELEKHLENIQNEEKRVWTKNIVRTNLTVYAIKLDIIKKIAKDIFKGNYNSFLDIMPNSSYEILIISAFIISEIKDFEMQKRYLKIYSEKCDNWSNCDSLKFKIKNHEKEYLDLSKEFIKSQHPFARRIGINILFSLLKTDKYLNEIFSILNSFENETEYYVNMVNAWIICELFIKHRYQTIIFLEDHHLNKFTINKTIQKCRDSYRISKFDKEMLLKYKIK